MRYPQTLQRRVCLCTPSATTLTRPKRGDILELGNPVWMEYIAGNKYFDREKSAVYIVFMTFSTVV